MTERSLHELAEQALIDELSEQDMAGVTAAGAIGFGLSRWLGNKGRFCTLTKECQQIC